LFLTFQIAFSAHGPLQRTWSLSSSRDFLKLQSKSYNYSQEDEFDFFVRLKANLVSVGIFKTTLQYRSSVDNGNETTMEFGFDLDNIVEFDSSDSNIYTGKETIYSQWPPDDKGSRSWENYWDAKYDNGTNMIKMSWEISTNDRTTSATKITLRIHVVQILNENGTASFDPNSVKFDIEISNYTYKGKNSRLALVSKIVSRTYVDNSCQNCTASKPIIIIKDTVGAPLGLFTWDPTIKVDKKEIVPVVAYLVNKTDGDQDNQSLTIFFTFLTHKDNQHPSLLEWDPTLSLDYIDSPNSNNYPVIIAIAIAILIAVMLFLTTIIVLRGYMRKDDYDVIN